MTNLVENGLAFGAGPAYLQGMTGTALGPIPVWMGNDLAWFVEPMVPLGETLFGLGLKFGVLVRLASVFGGVFTTLFWIGNAGFGHGLVDGDLVGLLLFAATIVLGAGRYYGFDAIVARTSPVESYPRLRYLLGRGGERERNTPTPTESTGSRWDRAAP